MAGRKHTGIVDEEKAKQLRFFDDAARDKAKVLAWLANEEQGTVVVKDDEPVHEMSRQMGSPLNYPDFEAKIRKLPDGDNYVFDEYPQNPIFKVLRFRMPDGSLRGISVYGKTLIPEYSTIVLESKIVRDWSVSTLKPMDMPGVIWDASQKRHVSKDGSLLPGWKKVYTNSGGENPYDPQSRGYRTVLMKIVSMGLATPQEVEKVFGRSSRASWMSLHKNTGYRW